MDLSEAIAHAKRGNALLFTGAGFSLGATNSRLPPNNQVPSARVFARDLADQLNSKAEYPLQVVSQAYKQREGEHGLVRELLSNFTIHQVTERQKEIAALPWSRVYTTNYDSCFEISALAASGRGKAWTSLTLDSSITSQKECCIHVNGHVSNLTVKSLDSQVKLTHSSYSAEPFAQSKWSEQLRQDANFARAVFFVGYSMSDLDIARVFTSIPSIKNRTFFVVSPTEDEIAISPLSEFGTVLKIGVDGFATKIENVPITEDKSPHRYTWLSEYELPEIQSKPADVEAFDLITKGAVNSSAVAWSMGSALPTYCVPRSVVQSIAEAVKSGKHWFLCHADLGNGKSLVKEQLSYVLKHEGYRIFWDTDNDNHKALDLSALTREKGDIAVIFDASSERFEAIDGILKINLPNIVVVVMTRTTLFELGEGRYNQHMPDGYLVYDLNRLPVEDAAKFVQLFNHLGLWGEMARNLDNAKENFVRINCEGAISKLVVSVFEESYIGRRIQVAAKTLLNNKSDLAAAIVASFLINRIGHAPSTELLTTILNKDVQALTKTAAFKEAGEFIRDGHGSIIIRSSIISDFLLRTSISPEILIYHIETFVRRLSELKRNSAVHHIFTELQRFPFLITTVGSTKRSDSKKNKDIIIAFYQSIKELKTSQRNALFWLHYAMARLEFNEFEIAATYFEDAKEFAKGQESETRDVNNYFARFLIDSRIRSDEYNDYFKAFDLAHQILIDQIHRDSNRHFPFRQAAKYVEFISYRRNKLTTDEIGVFVTLCKQVRAAIERMRGPLAGSEDVKRCYNNMQRAVDIALG